MARTYRDAGVDFDAEEATVRALAEGLASGEVRRGHYAGLVPFGDHYLAMATDGVGTKLLVAKALERWDTVGIDCVAMNVNDLVCVGATPLAFVDYLAVEAHDEAVARAIAEGLSAGCKEAGCAIVGGETATMPEVVSGLDLAGAAVGAVAKEAVVDGSAIAPGDALVGLASSGLHSNGFTLARSIVEEAGLAYADPWPGDDDAYGDATVGELLLTPTRIYVRPVLALLDALGGDVHGLAHVTGGGVTKLRRLAPEAEVGYEITEPLDVPPVLAWLQQQGGVEPAEMHRVFNMGMGFCCVVAADRADDAIEALGEGGVVGEVVDEPGVRVPARGVAYDP